MPDAPRPANLTTAFASIDRRWNPRLLAQVNDAQVRLAKLQGEFVWHSHEYEDEFFLVIKGELVIHLRDRDVTLREGDCVTIPRGVEHKPVAKDEVHVLLVEPASTISGGDTDDPRSVADPEPI